MAKDKYTPNVNKGDERRRVWRAEIESPAGGPRSVTVHREVLALRGNGQEARVEQKPSKTLVYTAELGATVIPKRNPLDNSSVGTMTIDEAHIAIYSLLQYIMEQADTEEAVQE